MRPSALWAVVVPTWILPGLAQTTPVTQENSIGLPVGDVPSCALPCMLDAIDQSTCDRSDRSCICRTTSIENEASNCILASCSFQQALAAKNATYTSCDRPVRDRGPLYNRTNITLGSVTAALVLLRLLFRLRFTPTPLGLDDHFLHLAFVTALPSTAMNSEGLVANGLGRDVWTIEWDKIMKFAKFFYVMQITYMTHIPFLKTAMLLFFLRIFPDETCKKLLRATIVVNAVGGAAFVGVSILQCWPVQYAWEKWEEPDYTGRCVDRNVVVWVHAAWNILLDFWMIFLPLKQVWQLQMHWKKKIGVVLMFGVGTFITVVSILRLQSLVDYANSDNPTFDQWEIANWSTIEVNVGIMCACMPAIRGLLVRFFPVIFGSGTNGGTRDEYGNMSGSIMLSSANHNWDGQRSTAEAERGPEAVAVGGKRDDDADTSDGAQSTKGITYSRSFTVEYGTDHDESSLVIMRPAMPKHGGKDSMV